MKQLLKKLICIFGYDIVKHCNPPVKKTPRLLQLLRHHNIDLVLDVGANVGQYAYTLFSMGFEGRVVSFEPLSTAHARLLEVSQRFPLWQVAERCALGAEDGECEINIAANSMSSSVLPMMQAHLDAAPDSAYVGGEKVPLRKLSSVASPYLHGAKAVLLKVDTQGYEDRVLDGAEELLPLIAGMTLELSLVPMYDGQMLLEEFMARLMKLGYAVEDLEPGFANEQTGRLLQIDATFFRQIVN